MASAYLDMVKDALYPDKKGLLTKNNRYLAIIEPKMMSGDDIIKLRKKLRLSRSMFASVLSVSAKTVEAWESGRNAPSGPALRLMNMISSYPDVLTETGTVTDVILEKSRSR